MDRTQTKLLTGTDWPVEVFLRDTNGQAVNPNTELTGLLIYLYYEDGDILNRYSLNSKTGFDPITVVDASNGQVLVKAQSALTQKAKQKRVYAEVKTEADNSNYQNNTFYEGVRDLLIGKVEKAHSTHQDP